MKTFLILLVANLAFVLSAFSQGTSINSTGVPAHPSALIDLSSTTKGALLPRMTTFERDHITSPAQSLLIFNTTTNCFESYVNGGWYNVACPSPCNSTAGAITGDAIVCQGQSYVSYKVSIVNAIGFLWTYSGTGADIYGSADSIAINFASTATSGTLSVIATNVCAGVSNVVSSSLPIIVNALPDQAGPISGPAAVCGGQYTYSVAPINNATSYTWTFDGTGAVISGNTTTTVTVDFSSASSGTLSVVGTNPCGNGTAYSPPFYINVDHNPSPGFIVTPQVVLVNQPVILVPTTSRAITCNWTFDNGSITSSTNNTPTVSWSSTGNFDVTLNVCNSSSTTNTITVVDQLTTPVQYDYSGSMQTFTVPAGMTVLTIDAYGAQGGTNSSSGQGGAYGAWTQATFSVNPGDVLNIFAGGQPWDNSQGGFNGGGKGFGRYSDGGSGGGGASDVRFPGTSLSDRIMVAGGGGGFGGASGGCGGNPDGHDGSGGSFSGSGGTQTAGGSGETVYRTFGSAEDGSLGLGGIGGSANQHGGGGGGGYYGGGGGDYGGGGGGSSYTSGLNAIYSACNQYGNGRVLISWCTTPAVPAAGSSTPAQTQIEWNWNPVTGATGYKYNTVDDYPNAADNGPSTNYIQTGLTCNTPNTLYVWAYNNCSNSPATALTQTTSSCVWSCGNPFTINHTAGTVAPVTKTVTYGTLSTNLSGATKCWITQNLGADQQATSANDNTEASAGWYWQFNRMQGYKHDGAVRTPNTAWIDPVNENSDWLSANDPCTIELGAGWRIPTYTEWFNADANGQVGGWDNHGETYADILKLHAAGYLNDWNAALDSRGGTGFFWSSTQNSAGIGWTFHTTGNDGGMYDGYGKSFGFGLRCIKD